MLRNSKKKLAVIGASGHGKVAADIASLIGYDEIVFYDDNGGIRECGGYPVAGKVADAVREDCDVFVAVGNGETRKKLTSLFADGRIATLIHPSAVVARDVSVGSGTVVMAGAVINPGAGIGKGCIINTCASVDHDCTLGDFVHVAVGAHLCGTVTVGDLTWIGAGSTVINNVSICGGCMIGAGAVVVENIDARGTYVGVPARMIK